MTKHSKEYWEGWTDGQRNVLDAMPQDTQEKHKALCVAPFGARCDCKPQDENYERDILLANGTTVKYSQPQWELEFDEKFIKGLNFYALQLSPRETKIFEYYNKKKIKSSFILWKNNCLNKWAIKIYKNLKLKCSISENKQEDEHSSINVMGDTIIQVQYDKNIIEKLRRFFEQNKSIQEAKIEEITKLAHTPCEIKFILYKNKSLAKTLRESYKKHLK